MPAARKRGLQEVDSENGPFSKSPSTLHRIRNMWQFANLFQFIMLFGKALKLDDNIDIEVRPLSQNLAVLAPPSSAAQLTYYFL